MRNVTKEMLIFLVGSHSVKSEGPRASSWTERHRSTKVVLSEWTPGDPRGRTVWLGKDIRLSRRKDRRLTESCFLFFFFLNFKIFNSYMRSLTLSESPSEMMSCIRGVVIKVFCFLFCFWTIGILLNQSGQPWILLVALTWDGVEHKRKWLKKESNPWPVWYEVSGVYFWRQTIGTFTRW